MFNVQSGEKFSQRNRHATTTAQHQIQTHGINNIFPAFDKPFVFNVGLSISKYLLEVH